MTKYKKVFERGSETFEWLEELRKAAAQDGFDAAFYKAERERERATGNYYFGLLGAVRHFDTQMCNSGGLNMRKRAEIAVLLSNAWDYLYRYRVAIMRIDSLR